MPVVERPRRHNYEEGQGRATKTDVDGVFEVLEDEADDPSNDLCSGLG
jgi:hypothetical protein